MMCLATRLAETADHPFTLFYGLLFLGLAPFVAGSPARDPGPRRLRLAASRKRDDVSDLLWFARVKDTSKDEIARKSDKTCEDQGRRQIVPSFSILLAVTHELRYFELVEKRRRI